jgi:hypothetical protein
MEGERERGRRIIYDFGHDRSEEDDDARWKEDDDEGEGAMK